MANYYGFCPFCNMHHVANRNRLKELLEAGHKSYPCPECNVEVDIIKNWRGRPSHPIDNWAFFKTTDKELDEMAEKFDRIRNAMREAGVKIEVLEDLVGWARSEAVIDNDFNNSEDA